MYGPPAAEEDDSEPPSRDCQSTEQEGKRLNKCCVVPCCPVAKPWVLLCIRFHLPEFTAVSSISARSKLCRHQRDVSIGLDVRSAQPYVSGGPERVCPGLR